MPQPSLRILEVCFSRSGGGLELYMANISEQLSRAGHRVWSMAPAGSFLEKQLRRRQLNMVPLEPRFGYLDVFTARRLAKFLRRHQIDILHAHQSRDLSILVLARQWAGRGKIVFTRQMESSRKKKDPFHRWLYRNLDGLIAITERIKRQVRENTPLPPGRVYRLYYGIDLARFRPDAEQRRRTRKKYGIAPEELVVGIVGRLEEGKGQHILLQAVSRLTEQLPHLRVMIIGGETVGQSGYEDYLRRLSRDLGLEERVIFTGFQENVPAVAAALDVVVLASKKETFGLSLIECMAQEIAPVGTNAGGVPEIIQPGVNGLLVPPLNPDALASALEQLLVNDELRHRLARKARQSVRERFDLPRHLEGLEKIFYRVLNTSS